MVEIKGPDESGCRRLDTTWKRVFDASLLVKATNS
jgi:hypothetical protein